NQNWPARRGRTRKEKKSRKEGEGFGNPRNRNGDQDRRSGGGDPTCRHRTRRRCHRRRFARQELSPTNRVTVGIARVGAQGEPAGPDRALIGWMHRREPAPTTASRTGVCQRARSVTPVGVLLTTAGTGC